MQLKSIVGVLALLAMCACGSSAERPNVILIVADDLGWADLGCYGSTFHRTPNLDRLAAEGMRFTDAYAACPVCSPSRVALLTGCMPQRFQITDWLPGRTDRPDQRLLRPKLNQALPLEATTLTEMLKAAGYATAHIGKWHLGGKGFSPREQGFDLNIGGDASGSPLSYFAPFGTKQSNGSYRYMPGLEQASEGEYLTDRYTSEAEKFIAAHAAEPFFVYLPHNAVHIPLQAKREMIEKYAKGPQPGKQSNATYAAMLESLDEGVGRIIAKLRELKLDRKTLVVFTSDNGGLSVLEGGPDPVTINSPLREGKGYLYEGGIRIPLLVWQPGIVAEGKVCRAPVSGQDILPTVCELAGIPLPDPIDGVSFKPQLSGSQEAVHEELGWHYPHYSNQGGKPGGAIRVGDLKLIEFYETGRRELFDVRSDLSESRNLSQDRPGDVERLAKRLAAWREKVGALMPTPNPDFKPNPEAADGTITMHARTADVFGSMLRYEPLPHKNTLGYWVNADDYATFEFTVVHPGKFALVALQGCGSGQGGSVVTFGVGDQTLEMTVEDTGHFQNFKERLVGRLSLDKPGRYTLRVAAKTKAKAAVMDLRQVVLKPVEP
jgi:arylsulfatase A-like enzyme